MHSVSIFHEALKILISSNKKDQLLQFRSYNMTKKYQVKVLDVDGSLEEESYTFQLKDNAMVEDLKVAFSKEDIYEPDQLRMSYKIASGTLRKHKND